jgi:general secretion pathway protein D
MGGEPAASRYGYHPSRAVSGALLGEGTQSMAVRAPNATVAADPNTNSIIVIAAPGVQQNYAELIKRLDERRPQVQIECTIVTLDTTDGANFAIDIAKLGGFASSKLLTFSSFGVASVDIKTGTLAPAAAQGGTVALLSPGTADVVIRALSTHSRARLVSAPQLLVNDNGKGKLQSVAQQPFAEILDTASLTSRTGLGGQAEAGTTITVEPHISQDDYLQLAYSVELSSFTGAATAGLPPPSQKNTVDSTVTIPDGYTIVVGGLNQKNFTSVLNSLPIIDQIPIINLLFGSRSVQHSDTTLFVFIRPVILRDDKFDDLKYLSDRQTRKAGLPGAYPASEPIPIK